jgi:hypothetical protein
MPPSRASATAKLLAFMQNAAGSGGVDCGFAIGSLKKSRAYVCAERLFHLDRRFYFASRIEEVADLRSASISTTSFGHRILAEGWFSKGDGLVSSATLDSSGNLHSDLLFAKAIRHPPMRVGGIVFPPELLTRLTAHTAPGLDGILIFECLISETGGVEDATILKSLPGEAPRISQHLVRESRFQPATVLGYPVPVRFNVTVRSEGGTLYLVNYAGR